MGHATALLALKGRTVKRNLVLMIAQVMAFVKIILVFVKKIILE
jgi:hypothetical protein